MNHPKLHLVSPIASGHAEILQKMLTGVFADPFSDKTELCSQILTVVRHEGKQKHQGLAIVYILHIALFHSIFRARALYKEFSAVSELNDVVWQYLGSLLGIEELKIKNLKSNFIKDVSLMKLLVLVSSFFADKKEFEYLLKLLKEQNIMDFALLNFVLAEKEFNLEKYENAHQHLNLVKDMLEENSLLCRLSACFDHPDNDLVELREAVNGKSLLGLLIRFRQLPIATIDGQISILEDFYHSDLNLFNVMKHHCIQSCMDILSQRKNISVNKLVIRFELMPKKSPVCVEHWPWRIRIYSLGRFGVYNMKGEDLSDMASCKKPFELLKVLLAQGGRQVSSTKMMDMLWPEAEGDVASRSFSTTLHRLRKIMGKNALILKNGKLSLDEYYCWVDIWHLSRSIDRLQEKLTQSKSKTLNVSSLISGISHMYKGEFLSSSMESWVLPLRSRIKNRVLQVLHLAKDQLNSADAISALEYSISNIHSCISDKQSA